MVRKDVHGVEHEALIARLARTDSDLKILQSSEAEREKERATLRNQMYVALLGAALSLVTALLVAMVK
jgi:hypothetical protein